MYNYIGGVIYDAIRSSTSSLKKIYWDWVWKFKGIRNVINAQAAQGYRLHTITTASAQSTGFFGGDRIQATLVFEKIY